MNMAATNASMENENRKCSSTHDMGKDATKSSGDTRSDSKDDPVFKLSNKIEVPVYTPEIDITWLFLIGLASALRLYNLSKPSHVVFDEVHFGRFTSYFMQNRFFFDVHPPLGKLLLALAAYLTGYDGTFEFNEIGQVIPADQMQHVYYLRLVPAIFGILLVPTVYEIILELGCSYWFAVFGGLLICFENMILVQSRFILLDSPMLFFIAFSICSYIKFVKQYYRPFTLYWWIYLICLGVSITATVSIKYNGFLTVILIGGIAAFELWMLIGDITVPARSVYKHIIARGMCLIVLPMLLYLLQFYVMFAVLYKSGPHDNMMSSAFQRTLHGGLEAITKHQAEVVSYGSQITLRNTHSKQCWLHSHEDLYPVKYPDGRGSSAQQQVTCYSFKDINNWWIVKSAESDDLKVNFPPVFVKNGDIIHLVHGTTGRGLNSHDVAAPLNPQLMEVSGYVDHNVSMDGQFGWRLEIVNPDPSGLWKAIESQIRLVHVNTSASLRVSGEVLPEWGFHQFEVGTDRMINTQESIFNVEEHNQNLTIPENITEEEAKEILSNGSDITAINDLSFWGKFWELQVRMLKANSELVQEHNFASRPTEWPIMRRGVAYWIDQNDNKQIFCIGNPLIWWVGSMAVFFYMLLFLMYLLRRRRKIHDITYEEWNLYVIIGYLLVGGYVINYIPFFPVERTLFVHHYLSSLLFKIILIPVLADHFHKILFGDFPYLQIAMKCCCVLYCAAVIWTFKYFSPLSYGTTALTGQELQQRKWFSTWDFLIHPGS
ncbi:protein O-mannosyl-transferase 1-like [Hydractinia symbiolongicarpus]|uniref:protein O-mannosyl-transferase 1-like n=1 Tax=Hydractinia symbiolongicarpus TaxID=13093 RepID=UPI00254C76B0|nr:protein O-mannosyl-transferase 1-like [Hydractinia symbiolongicarpus]